MTLLTLINATDLTQWASRRKAQEQLPLLMRRLIHASIKTILKLAFPSGDSVQLGGWDGYLEVEKGSQYVPDGVSVWELGVQRDIKKKADEDYEKRKRDSLGLDPKQTTFVFVTPRRWGAKDSWLAKRQAEGFWHEVRAYDADDLEQWLQQAPAVHLWFSTLMDKHPTEATDLTSFWKDWSEATLPHLSPQLITSGRKVEVDKLLEWLRETSSVLSLNADSQTEALAFFAATIQQLPEEEKDSLHSRVIIVSNKSAWPLLCSSDQALILIPTFEIGDLVSQAIREGHHVFLPLGRESNSSKSTILLPRLSNLEARKVLLEMGVPELQINTLASLARRSLSALRRKLAIASELQQPIWSKPLEAHSLLPALLAGGWQDDLVGDQKILAHLADTSYKEIRASMKYWSNVSDPPVRRIANTWLLSAKDDTWIQLARFLDNSDLQRFESVVLDVFSPINLQPKHQRAITLIPDQDNNYSKFLCQNLTDTVALIGAYDIQFTNGSTGQELANNIVRSIFHQANNNWYYWVLMSDFLPSLAEAAPDEFLSAINVAIKDDSPLLKNLFQADEEIFFNDTSYIGLLSALELLAWHPDYFTKSTQLLTHLASIDPGGRLMNRPANSLRSNFCSWYPQTKANLQQRLNVLNTLMGSNPIVAWKLLLDLLATRLISFFPTYRPQWREWVIEINQRVTADEYRTTIQRIIELLLNDVGEDANRWKDIIERISDIPLEQVDIVLDKLINMNINLFTLEERLALQEVLGVIIGRHSKYQGSDWALPQDVLNKLQKFYDLCEPDDVVSKYIWLFSDNNSLWDRFSGSFQEIEQKIDTSKKNAVKQIYDQGGFPLIVEFAQKVNRPFEVGYILGDYFLPTEQKKEEKFLAQFLGSNQVPYSELIRGFIDKRRKIAGWEWAENKITNVVQKRPLAHQRSAFFMALPFASQVWDLLYKMDAETMQSYWSQVAPSGAIPSDCEHAVTMFLQHDRPDAAFIILSNNIEHIYTKISPELIVEVLEQVTQISLSPNIDITSFAFRIDRLLQSIDTLDVIPEDRVAKLELSFLPILTRYERRGPRNLHNKLARDPKFFVQVIEILTPTFRLDNNEPQVLSEVEKFQIRCAYDLLKSWNTIPGTQENGSIDPIILGNWVKEAREIVKGHNHASIVDQFIGEVLGYSPIEFDGSWSAIPVWDVIETVNSEDLNRGFIRTVYNRRGVVHKDLLEGGEQERNLEKIYREYAQKVRDRWPHTAAILRKIADIYKKEASLEDIRAELDEDLLQ